MSIIMGMDTITVTTMGMSIKRVMFALMMIAVVMTMTMRMMLNLAYVVVRIVRMTTQAMEVQMMKRYWLKESH